MENYSQLILVSSLCCERLAQSLSLRMEASAMPLLEHNISSNEHLFEGSRPQALVLDWDDEDLPTEVNSLQTGFDLIV